MYREPGCLKWRDRNLLVLLWFLERGDASPRRFTNVTGHVVSRVAFASAAAPSEWIVLAGQNKTKLVWLVQLLWRRGGKCILHLEGKGWVMCNEVFSWQQPTISRLNPQFYFLFNVSQRVWKKLNASRIFVVTKGKFYRQDTSTAVGRRSFQDRLKEILLQRQWWNYLYTDSFYQNRNW